MSIIRTFLAIPIPGALQQSLSRIPQGIIDTRDKINWVASGNIHITMNFLGDTDASSIDLLGDRLNNLCNSVPAFKMSTLDTGVYPHANDPRVLWVGAAPFDQTLSLLRSDLNILLKEQGYRVDNRKFQPHITLGRVKSISRKSTFIHDFLIHEVREQVFEVGELVWFESTLTPSGARYEVLKEFKFNGGGQS